MNCPSCGHQRPRRIRSSPYPSARWCPRCNHFWYDPQPKKKT